MSSSCQHKEAAWDFIRTLIMPRSTKGKLFNVALMPVNLYDFELLLFGELKEANEIARRSPRNPEKFFPPIRIFTYGPPVTLMHLVTEDKIQRFQELVDHTTQLYWPEDDLANIVWEMPGPCFAGDKTLDQTIDLLDNRVSLYLNEQR